MIDDAQWILLGFPLAGLAFGLGAYFWLRRQAKAFERKHYRGQVAGE